MNAILKPQEAAPYTLGDYFKAVGVRKIADWCWDVVMPKVPRKHQIEALAEFVRNTRYGDYSEAGCVSADTEYLTPTGWSRIDQYTGGKVAQFHPDTKEIEFVDPIRYIKSPCSEMIEIAPARNTSQKLSFEHRVLYYKPDGSWDVSGAKEYYDWHMGVPGLRGGQRRYFCPVFNVPASLPGLPYSDDMLRLLVAVVADGHFSGYKKGRRTGYCVVRVKKDRKIFRLGHLLRQAEVNYKEHIVREGAAEGFHVFSFHMPIYAKEFTEEWWSADADQLNIIADELQNWDAAVDPRRSGGIRFSSFSRKSADFAQYAFASTGRKSSLSMLSRFRRGKTEVEYVVQVSNSQSWKVSQGYKNAMRIVPNPEGFKYCFEVPSSFLLLRRDGYIFATGNSGKSLSSQALAIYRCMSGNSTVILTPPKLNLQFAESLKRDYPGIPYSVEVYNGELDSRQALTDRFEKEGWPDILVMSYRTFVGGGGKKGNRTVKDKGGDPVSWKTFKARGYTMLIVDEAICVKNHKSQIHRAVEEFCGNPYASNGLLLMSGTPVENNIEDTYGFFNLLDPMRYRSFRSFERIHVCLNPRSTFRQVVGYDNIPYLYQGLYASGRRVTKKEVLDLPEMTVADVPVVLSKQHKALYDKVLDEMLLELPDGELLDFTSSQKLYMAAQRMLVCPEEITQTKVVSNAMLETLDELLDTLAGRKVMIGVWFRDSVAKLLEHLKDRNPVALYGGMNPIQTEQAKVKFMRDPACSVIVTNFRSGGVGVDGLQEVCSDAIMLEMITVPGLMDQWVARLLRSGQKEPVNINILVPKGTIAVKLRANLLKKEAANNEVIGDKKALLRDLLGE